MKNINFDLLVKNASSYETVETIFFYVLVERENGEENETAVFAK